MSDENDNDLIPSATPVSAMQVHIPRLAKEHYETREYLRQIQKQLLKLTEIVDELVESMADEQIAELKKAPAKKTK